MRDLIASRSLNSSFRSAPTPGRAGFGGRAMNVSMFSVAHAFNTRCVDDANLTIYECRKCNPTLSRSSRPSERYLLSLLLLAVSASSGTLHRAETAQEYGHPIPPLSVSFSSTWYKRSRSEHHDPSQIQRSIAQIRA
ncbi:hypothetical protein BDN72DRAFT_837574 [Pluteus cervinus]|uniref:Uncharacterized protein n=1 Tax=Pluteus cervinus TaxID=181527 RepID=A0ACD3B0G8_9AGAR|nr:hypothetical protein BDN72DRAFT_837574 [Pluteus cervinus]